MLLAFDEEGILDEYVKEGLKSCTKETITDGDKLKDVLKTVKENGFDVSCGEFIDGVTSISAPVRNHAGRVLYAVSVVGPAKRIKARQAKVIHQAKQAARDISERIGYWKRI